MNDNYTSFDVHMIYIFLKTMFNEVKIISFEIDKSQGGPKHHRKK